MQGKLRIEKEGKTQTLDFGLIDKRDFKLLVERYKSMGYQTKEVGDGTAHYSGNAKLS